MGDILAAESSLRGPPSREMGNCMCFYVPKDEEEDSIVDKTASNRSQPTQEERRRAAAEAADRRAAESNNRGIKDPNSVRRLEEKRAQIEQRQQAGDNIDNAPL